MDVVGSGCGALQGTAATAARRCKAAPHNRYQPHPSEPDDTPNAVTGPLIS